MADLVDQWRQQRTAASRCATCRPDWPVFRRRRRDGRRNSRSVGRRRDGAARLPMPLTVRFRQSDGARRRAPSRSDFGALSGLGRAASRPGWRRRCGARVDLLPSRWFDRRFTRRPRMVSSTPGARITSGSCAANPSMPRMRKCKSISFWAGNQPKQHVPGPETLRASRTRRLCQSSVNIRDGIPSNYAACTIPIRL